MQLMFAFRDFYMVFIVYSQIYDITLLRKNTRDAESADMLDIIFRQRKYAVDMTYNFGDMLSKVYAMVNKNRNESASLYEKNADKVQKAIDQLFEKYAAMN